MCDARDYCFIAFRVGNELKQARGMAKLGAFCGYGDRWTACARRSGRIIGKHARHRRQVADVALDHAKQRADGFLVRGDPIEIAHAIISPRPA